MSLVTHWMHGVNPTKGMYWPWPWSPARIPRDGVKKYYWNWKCLEAPKPYFDSEGYYYWRPWVVRKIIPGLVKMPEPMVINKLSLAALLKDYDGNVRNSTRAINDLLNTQMEYMQ